MLGDMDVPPFWPPFLTFWGLNSIFLGYFFSSTNTKTIFGVLKLPILTEFDLLGPKFNFSLDLFGSNFQRPAAHPRQFSDRVPPPPGYAHPTMVTLVNIMVMNQNGWLTSFLFHVNRLSHSWDKAISNSDLETPRSRSWVWSKGKVKQFLRYSHFKICPWNIQCEGHE